MKLKTRLKKIISIIISVIISSYYADVIVCGWWWWWGGGWWLEMKYPHKERNICHFHYIGTFDWSLQGFIYLFIYEKLQLLLKKKAKMFAFKKVNEVKISIRYTVDVA